MIKVKMLLNTEILKIKRVKLLIITVEPRLSGLGGTWVNSPDN